MVADVHQVLRILDTRAVHVHLRNGQLIGRVQSGSIPAEVADLIRRNKTAIVAELQERERMVETVTNILALAPTDFVTYEIEIRNAPPDDEHMPHDREALRRARMLKRQAQLLEHAVLEQEAA